jgi:lipopolysaccharide transport system permease protein
MQTSEQRVSVHTKSARVPGNFHLALADMTATIHAWRVVVLLGWTEVAKRYRRSLVGPFWLTLSMAGTIVALSFVYSYLFGHTLSEYLPFLSVGFVLWTFLSQTIVDSATVYAANGAYLHQIRIPRFIFPLQLVFRQIVILAHNAAVLVVVLILFPHSYNATCLLFLPAFLLLVVFAVSMATITGTLCTRFRDLPQIVANLMQIAFFVTPVLWMPAQLPIERRFVVEGNPFAVFLELTRAPLLGEIAATELWMQAVVITLVSMALAFFVFAMCRARISYWL